MEVTTLRLPKDLLDALEREYEEQGYSHRAEYIRIILRNRFEGIAKPPAEEAADYATADRVRELEQRVAYLENRVQQGAAETEPDSPRSAHRPSDRREHFRVLPEDASEIRAQLPEEFEKCTHTPEREDILIMLYLELRDRGKLTKSELLEYHPEHAAGLVNTGDWYETLVDPELRKLPGVTPPTPDDQAWRFDEE